MTLRVIGFSKTDNQDLDDLDYVRKCLYAVHLKYFMGWPWAAIANCKWPRDPQTDNPYPHSTPMWRNAAEASQAVKTFQKRHLEQVKEDFIDEVRMRSEARRIVLSPMVAKGHIPAIAEMRAEDEFVVKILGGFAPVKIAPTTPDGTEQYRPSRDSVKSIDRKLAQLEQKRKEFILKDTD